MRVIALVADAYGGRGGIALYNRHFLKALCDYPGIQSVIALPRNITYDLEEMPERLAYVSSAAGSKLTYLKECLFLFFSGESVDLIICGHLNLLPCAYFLKLRHGCPVVPIVYGVEAWTPRSRLVVDYLCRKLDAFISIRRLTASRFKAWAGIGQAQFHYLPNCIDETQYRVAPKRQDLVDKYSLSDKRVLMTAGRLDEGEIDQNKGFDEVLEVLPQLRKEIHNLVYLVVGDGDDRKRLIRKAESLGLGDMVIFAGYIPENDKADYYRLADVFAMPGSNPIFDRYPFRFVFLEALACGVPVVGCRLEDEAECKDTLAKQLIIQVDPADPESIVMGIRQAFKVERIGGSSIQELYYTRFKERLKSIIDIIRQQSVRM